MTGADGMLGSNICRELLNKGYLVKAICLPNSGSNTIDELQIEKVYGNILDKDFLLREMGDCNGVIHTAGITTIWPRRLKIINDVNLQGTMNIAEAVATLNLDRMVHIGTASSFGHGTKKEPGNEQVSFNAAHYHMDYLDSKLKAQQFLLERHANQGLPVVIINPTFMIGPFDSGPSSGKMIIGLNKGTIPAYSSGGKNFVCTTDVATAAVNALILGRNGECYIAGNENLEFKEFFVKVSERLNKPFRMRAVPQVLILILGAFNSLFARATFKSPKISFTVARMASLGQYYSSEKAQKELMMPQTPIEEGISQCIEWFRSNGYIK